MALASWRDMVATILALENRVDADRRRCGATISCTSIYDACKSAKGVIWNRNWSFTGFACTHSKEWEFAKLKKKRPRRCRDPVIVKAQWAISDQRHQLKRQTSDKVKRRPPVPDYFNA